jgi:hypothetical protein
MRTLFSTGQRDQWTFEIVEEILSTLTPDTIARVFANWIERLKHVIDTNGDYT